MVGQPYTRALFGVTAWCYRRTRRVLYATATNIAFRRSAWTGYDTRLTQGGDELGLLRTLRRAGGVHFDRDRVTLTSSRRLRRGLLYNVFVTCLFFYLTAYGVNRLTGRQLVGHAPVVRPEGPAARSVGRGPRVLAALSMLAVTGLAVAWWITPVDVV